MPSRGNAIFSGEPLPVPPKVDNPELEAFHRKIVDYLRRLAGKLGRTIDTGGGGAGTVPVFSAYLSTEQNGPGSGYWTVDWTQIIQSDSIYSHTAGVITVSQTGQYLIHVDFYIDNSELGVSTEMVVNKNTGTLLTYSYCKIGSEGHYSNTIPVSLTAGDTIEIQLDGGGQLEVHTTRISITKVGE